MAGYHVLTGNSDPDKAAKVQLEPLIAHCHRGATAHAGLKDLLEELLRAAEWLDLYRGQHAFHWARRASRASLTGFQCGLPTCQAAPDGSYRVQYIDIGWNSEGCSTI